MKRRISLIVFLAFVAITVFAQTNITKLSLEGFNLTLVFAEEFSYEHDKSRNVVEKIENGMLTLKVDDGDPFNDTKVPLTIYTNKIEEIKLSGCNLDYDDEGKGKFGDFKLSLNSQSSAILNDLKMKRFTANLSSESNLVVGGNLVELFAEVKAASNIATDSLKVNYVKIDIEGASNAVLDMQARTVIINAQRAVQLMLVGTAKKLSLDGKMAVRVLGANMLIDEANINVAGGGEIVINAALMNENADAVNIHENYAKVVDKKKTKGDEFPF